MIKEEVYSFLIWWFCNSPGRAEEIGDIWFLYKDTYGIPLKTLEIITLEAAKEFAENNIDAVYVIVERLEKEKCLKKSA